MGSTFDRCGISITFGFQSREILLRKRPLLVSIRGRSQLNELTVPRFRYGIPGVTGKEVAIFDLYQGTGDAYLSKQRSYNLDL